jgi:site-specific DNA-cytosine methylase
VYFLTQKAIKINEKFYEMKRVEVKNEKSKWDIQKRSSTLESCRPIMTTNFGGNNILMDYRGGNGKTFQIRYFTVLEIERLFGYTDGYTDIENVSKNARFKSLGNSIPIFIVDYVLQVMK